MEHEGKEADMGADGGGACLPLGLTTQEYLPQGSGQRLSETSSEETEP